ncbi:MAG TPA: TPM domain-containing protein [Methylocella sp.]|nr:TPM domain-containing protein [Methylocella sp.]
MVHLSVEDQARVGAAIRAAEAQTAGEIVCVLARASSNYRSYATAWSALIALIVPWFLLGLTNLSVREIFLAQIVIFVGLYLILSESALGHRLIPRRALRAEAHRAAMEQFMIRGMARKKNRAGILIFVSLAEHYARIVADDGIASKVDQSVWQGAIDALLERVSGGDIADGFVIAVERCGRLLAEHFPAESGSEDELPDRLYLI